VYRNGRSVSTRYLTLHWFPRDDDPDGEARLGLAVPKTVSPSAVVRNTLKRRLRACWDELGERTRPGLDYVLVARQGLAEPSESRGHEWLVGQVADALQRVPPS
jgi:ribonuclease P protein component